MMETTGVKTKITKQSQLRAGAMERGACAIVCADPNHNCETKPFSRIGFSAT